MTPTFRRATRDDLPALLALLRDDTLGTKREAPADDPCYVDAFDAIERDPNQYLLAMLVDGTVRGMCQLTFTPGLSRAGAWRATVESVRIDAPLRGRGLGGALLEHAVSLARAQGCRLVQLTSDVRRTEAHRFYGRLGFKASHTGFKLELS